MDVSLNFQNFGSAWLGVLRGIPAHIELVCNGLFNLRGTNGRVEYHSEDKTIATFWTSENAMRRFFYNQHYLPREMGNHELPILREESQLFAEAQLAEMLNHHEEFMTLESSAPAVTFGNGTITAERPDNDMKDAILSHAFTEKDSPKRVDEIEN